MKNRRPKKSPKQKSTARRKAKDQGRALRTKAGIAKAKAQTPPTAPTEGETPAS